MRVRARACEMQVDKRMDVLATALMAGMTVVRYLPVASLHVLLRRLHIPLRPLHMLS